MYILCLIGLWTRSPKTEVEKLRIERLEVFLNVFAGFVNLGKFEKQRKLWPIFLLWGPTLHLSSGGSHS